MTKKQVIGTFEDCMKIVKKSEALNKKRGGKHPHPAGSGYDSYDLEPFDPSEHTSITHHTLTMANGKKVTTPSPHGYLTFIGQNPHIIQTKKHIFPNNIVYSRYSWGAAAQSAKEKFIEKINNLYILTLYRNHDA